ncbi:MAG TPA: hypothetical protein VFO35_07560 [Steroidobacteraceae bacterium]|nr:hypothetical protein [Steroidobacteraceae bacterium]
MSDQAEQIPPPAFVVQTFATAGAHVYRKVGQLTAQPGVDWLVLIVLGVSSEHAALAVERESR